jgi:hypothetical protein
MSKPCRDYRRGFSVMLSTVTFCYFRPTWYCNVLTGSAPQLIDHSLNNSGE